MASLNSIVSVTVSVVAARAAALGFGTPLILSHSAAWTERVRSYTSLAALGADFASTTPEYRAATAMFSQNPRPAVVKVGRANGTVPTQRWAVTPVVVNSDTYKLTVVDTAGVEHAVSITADSSTSANEIITALKNAIDALSLALTTSDQTTYLRIAANTPGAFFGVYVDDVAKLGIAMDHADSSLATELAAIQAYDASWYALTILFPSAASITAAAAWIEANGIHYFAAGSQDSAIVTTTGTSDIAYTEKGLTHNRTVVQYGKTAAIQFFSAGFLGRWLPFTPGAENTKFLQISGLTPDPLTDTQLANAVAKNAMVYDTTAGVAMTETGKSASGRWIDEIRGIDALVSDMGTRVFNLQLALANIGQKIPFTDAGIAQISGEVLASLKRFVRTGFLAEDPAPAVLAPKAADVSSADKAARNLPGVTGTATLAGAINSTQVAITLTT